MIKRIICTKTCKECPNKNKHEDHDCERLDPEKCKSNRESGLCFRIKHEKPILKRFSK